MSKMSIWRPGSRVVKEIEKFLEKNGFTVDKGYQAYRHFGKGRFTAAAYYHGLQKILLIDTSKCTTGMNDDGIIFDEDFDETNWLVVCKMANTFMKGYYERKQKKAAN